MSRATISAALIVRNEERFLEDCLESICRHVNEIVLVDTGSVDKTVPIAERYACRILHHPWSGDFSAARNLGLEAARHDWILYIDADERLELPQGAALSDLLGGTDCVAHSVLFEPRVGFTPYREIRLFRNDPEIRFRGVIHETVHPDILRKSEKGAMHVRPCDARIRHFGYEGDLTAKHHRNIPLLRRAIPDFPERVYLHVELGRALLALGEDEEAIVHLRRATDIAQGNPNGKHHIDGAGAWLALIDVSMGVDPAKALAEAESARLEYPDHKAIALSWARAAFEAGRSGPDQVAVLEELMAIDADSFVEPLMSYDKRIFREWPADLLGAIHARDKRFGAAADCYSAAQRYAPGFEPYRKKAELFAAMAKRERE